MKLGLVRHAQTTAAAGLCYGRTDVAVPPEAMRALAERIAPQLAGRRRRSSARPCSAAPAWRRRSPRCGPASWSAPMRASPRWIFGAWEGRPWSSIDRAEFDAWTRDFADARAGGSGESTRAFMQRVGEAFDEWREAGRDALWITHAGVIRAVWLLREGVRCAERADQWPRRPIAFGEWVVEL